MTDPKIKDLETIRQSILAELDIEANKLTVYKKDFQDSVRSIDQLTAMAQNLNLTINIMKSREGPTPVNREIAIPEYEIAWRNTDR